MEISTADLVICRTDDDLPDSRNNSLVIEREIREFDVKDAKDTHRRLVQLDIDHQYDIPVCEIYGHHIWHDGGSLHEHSPYSMELLVLLYRRIVDEIAEGDRVVAIGVGGRYLDMLYDLAENEGIELTVRDEPKESKSDQSVRRNAFLWVPIVLLDVFCSLFLSVLFRAGTASILVVYPVFRPETFRPLESYFDIEYDGSFYVLTLSYLLNYRSMFADEIPTVPIHCFESGRGFLSQCRFAVKFAQDLYHRKTERKMIDTVENETGIRLNRTVGSLYHRAAAFNFASCLRYETAQRAFSKSDYEALLLPSSDGLNKAIGLAAREVGVEIFLLPHTILHQPVTAEVTYKHTRFVEGSITRVPLQEANNIESAELGLPKHLAIRDRGQMMDPKSETGQILIGTQPYDDGRRQEFISDVLRAGLEATDYDLVIKIHPGEERIFYQSAIADLELTDADRERISITDGGLYQSIVDSDLMVTISSNVGIEAVILGTPTICYNKWSPDIRTPLYATIGTVPYIDNPESLSKTFDQDSFSHLYQSQDGMLYEQFMVRNNSLQTITEKIEDRFRASIQSDDR